MTEIEINVITGEVIETGERLITSVDVERAVQRHVDITAGQRGYRSGDACASYSVSTVETWAAEASAFIAWRDAVWQAVYAMQDAPPKTIEAVIAALPEMGWPE